MLRMTSLLASLLGGLLAWCAPLSAASSVYFISDLHFGVGREPPPGQQWSALEDFRWHDDLAGYLDFIATRSKDSAHLIVLGDMLELWQSHRMACAKKNGVLTCAVQDCPGTAPDSGCTQKEALERTRNIIAQHGATLRALGTFADRGKNKLTIVPGNHDAPLLMPAIAEELLRAIGAKPDRASIATDGYWLSDDGRILAEHGHQFDKVNSFKDWPRPYTAAKGDLSMRRPWGEQMVQSFYNRYEYEFQAIDNFESESKGVGFALRVLGKPAALSGGADFLKFLLLDTTFTQKLAFLNEKKQSDPVWDYEAIRTGNDPKLLVHSVDPADPLSAVMLDMLASGELQVRPADLTDEELDLICTRAEALADGATDRKTAAMRCPRVGGSADNLGYLIDKVLKRDDENMAKHLWAARQALGKQQRPVEIYIYGHTHAAQRPRDVKLAHDWNVIVANTGAFQRIATDEFLLGLGAATTDKPDFLRTLRLEDLPACYPFVLIDDAAKSAPLLRYWTKPGADRGTDAERCPTANGSGMTPP